MPVHKVGYRAWEGERTSNWSRWWIITETGFRIAFKSAWVRRILLACWLPVLYWGLAVFVLEQTLERPQFEQMNVDLMSPVVVETVENEINAEIQRQFVEEFSDRFSALPNQEALIEAIQTRDEDLIRHTLWSWLLMTFFRYPQGTAILFLLGFITPGMISQDVRSRAFLLYFSRPIGRLEYILGKMFVPIIFISLVTLVPAICLFVFGVTLSPDLGVLKVTWDIPIRVVLASLFVIVPTCSIAMMLSSITQESRFATFAWFAIWALGHAAWLAIVITQAIRLDNEPFSDEVLNSSIVNDWSVVSLYNNMSSVQSWIFGFQSFGEVWLSVAVLTGVTIFSLVVLYRGVSAPMNV